MNSFSGHSTPCRSFGSYNTSRVLEYNIRLSENHRKLRRSLSWGAVNTCLLAIVLYDIAHTCPIRMIKSILYLEYGLAVLFTWNILFHIGQYLAVSLNNNTLAALNKNKLASPALSLPSTPNENSLSQTPINWSAVSWQSNAASFNDSSGYMNSPSPFAYQHNSPANMSYDMLFNRQSANRSGQLSPNTSPSFSRADNSVEFINDEQSLSDYLKGYQMFESSVNSGNDIKSQPTLLNSFWTHPAARNKSEVSAFLKGCHYQLSPLSPGSSSSSPSGKSDDKNSPHLNHSQGLEMWRRFQVDSITLTQWNANIRMWISRTILERLVKEINFIDDALQKHGLSDIKVGGVGLDRLRKTAQTAPILQFVPTLSTLIPFLEISSNQEYLIKRIRDLAKGGCMSEFKWNGGSAYDSKEWNYSLPTDSAIIMHLFASYMDTQLPPMPNKPDVKPFTGNHFIKCTDKMPELSATTMAIHQVSEKPPHYRVIVGEEIFEMVKGYNNLFHSLLLFIYQVNKKEHGMLGRMNLGSLGVNILWVIDS